MMRWKNALGLLAIFLLGIVAGFGLGNLYGSNSYNAQLEQRVKDLESRFDTVNTNFLTLTREYNRLFALKGSTAIAVPVNSTAPVTTTAPTGAQAPTPAPKATTAPAPAKATPAPTGASAPAAGTSSGKAKADFKAVTIDGTGPLEGPPPLKVKFTDLSSGNITSWKWEFGDGETSTEQNPEHLYPKACPGAKNLCTVKLTVCGPDGCVTASKPDYLWISESCTGC